MWTDRCQGSFGVDLKRETSKGLSNIMNLGRVTAEVWTEGPNHTKIFVRMIQPDKKVIFLADVPDVPDAHVEIFGNAEKQPIIVWQAKNEEHARMGTTIKGAKDPLNATGSRRYYLHFEGKAELDSFLEVLKIPKDEWYAPQGRFVRESYVMPANKVVLKDDDMDGDWDAQDRTMTMEEMEDEYGHDVYEESQPF